ncbi:uncharacterized [Tachysurus ichikawai]
MKPKSADPERLCNLKVFPTPPSFSSGMYRTQNSAALEWAKITLPRRYAPKNMPHVLLKAPCITHKFICKPLQSSALLLKRNVFPVLSADTGPSTRCSLLLH